MASTRWRIYITATDGGGYASFAEIAMRTAYGGPNVCVGGTASASNVFSGQVAASAFDNNTSTIWIGQGLPAWIEYTFATPQDICELALLANSANAKPTAFRLEYWNGSAWVTTISRTGEPIWNGETRIYNQRPKMEWRLLCTGGTAGYTGVAALQLRTASGGADICTGGLSHADANYSGFPPANAFDNNASTAWLAEVGAGYPHYVRYSFTSPKEVVEYVIQAYGSNPEFTPTSFKLQFSDGSGGWTDADVRTGITGWTGGMTRTYSFTPVVTVDPPAGSGGSAAAARPQVFVCT